MEGYSYEYITDRDNDGDNQQTNRFYLRGRFWGGIIVALRFLGVWCLV